MNSGPCRTIVPSLACFSHARVLGCNESFLILSTNCVEVFPWVRFSITCAVSVFWKWVSDIDMNFESISSRFDFFSC
ncbi:hypothetical protein GOBAR_AA39693 [Gossypium barbadense]|uniref:Uncharacterized protein n=1 Tax=Gossypium barbadense TaxID=3634 RepID=A0A2P5VQ97_GOSBA|nr:hypothetical protein GOBAR_AA39693 [Gossypium barbadense]